MAVTRSHDWGNVAHDSGFRSRNDGTLKWWFMLAIIMSLGFHGLLVFCFEELGWGKATAPPQIDIVRPDRLKIDPELLKAKQAIKDIPKDIAPVDKPDLESFKPELDDFDKMAKIPENQEIDLSPTTKEIQNLVRATSPDQQPGNTAAASAAASLANMLAATPVTAPSEADVASAMAAVKSSVLSKPLSSKQMVLDGSATGKGDSKIGMEIIDSLGNSTGPSAATTKVQGFSSLEELINGGGQVGGSTAPILMPTDLLFDFGSDQLAEAAKVSLMKLGFLIQKNPNSLFIIEGHTDTIGDPDSNMGLSVRRANAVVTWLQTSLMLNNDRVRAVGMGESRPLSPELADPNGDKDQQSMNRRVEIKVRPRT